MDEIEAVNIFSSFSSLFSYRFFFSFLDLNLFVGQLTPKQRADKAVQHALDVQRAQSMGNYHRLCQLYTNAPNMGAYIMDHFIDRERIKALIVITKACVILSSSFVSV